MRRFLIAVVALVPALALAIPVSPDGTCPGGYHRVSGYTTKRGKVVRPYCARVAGTRG